VAWSVPAQAEVVLAGTATTNVEVALVALGIPHVHLPGVEDPDPVLLGLGAGDVIIISMDGGTGPFRDYTPFLTAGGHLIIVGGSDWDDYRTWASLYFNITDTGIGWHTDGDWHTGAPHPITQYMPLNHLFLENGHTYHMLAIAPTVDTTPLGTNDEGVVVAAVRSFAGGGTCQYMALDLGPRPGGPGGPDQDDFITPWVRGSLEFVTVVDTTPPTISCSVRRSLLWTPTRGMLDVGLSISVLDDIDPSPLVEVEVWSDEGNGPAPYSPDATWDGVTLRLRAERAFPGDGRVYLVIVRATDFSGNVASDSCTVVVPVGTTATAIQGVQAQASAAESTGDATGSPPPGYFPIFPAP
jgi:hypothetical protein